jgi:putative transposase
LGAKKNILAMARAKRHYIPGQIWHITHRCHKREFLLKFAKDKRRWLQWLYEAKKRYGLVILNYTVTSNHIHLLVADDTARNTIPNSIKLIAGRTGQEYNQRKNRKGAFWEDRYHATAIENGEHLLKCIVYIDLNMVRTGVVTHPSEWPYSGYNEIQKPRRKFVLIHYDRLRQLMGFDSYQEARISQKKWVEACLQSQTNSREDKWTRSLAVGSRHFIDDIKKKMGIAAKWRKRLGDGDSFQLRESTIPYNAYLGVKNSDIGDENAYFWE